MDGRRFDATVQALATASRRSALGVVLGMAFVLFGPEKISGKPRRKHQNNKRKHPNHKRKQNPKKRHVSSEIPAEEIPIPIEEPSTEEPVIDAGPTDEIPTDEIPAEEVSDDEVVTDAGVTATPAACICPAPIASNACSCVVYVRNRTGLCGSGNPNTGAADYTDSRMKSYGWVRVAHPRAGAIMVYDRGKKCAGTAAGHMALVKAGTYRGKPTPRYDLDWRSPTYLKWAIHITDTNSDNNCTSCSTRLLTGIQRHRRPGEVCRDNGTGTACADWRDLNGVRFYVRSSPICPSCCRRT